MLVKLYNLPPLFPILEKNHHIGIQIRRPNSWEKATLLKWVKTNFNDRWAYECEATFITLPPSSFIAEKNNDIIGFASYDGTAKNFFGPTGVSEKARGQGIGTALLMACLHAMKEAGYGYAIIGGVGPASFYAKTVGATLIEGSNLSIYFNNREPSQ